MVTTIYTTPGQCVYWRGCSRPPVRGSYFCAFHRVCTRCGELPTGNPPTLRHGMCMACYSWWRRHKSPDRHRIAAAERERNKRRTEAARAARQAA